MWPKQIVTDSLAHVLPFVAAGMGLGVTLDFPANTRHPEVRVIRMSGFAPVNIACHWRRPETRQIATALRIATEQLKTPSPWPPTLRPSDPVSRQEGPWAKATAATIRSARPF